MTGEGGREGAEPVIIEFEGVRDVVRVIYNGQPTVLISFNLTEFPTDRQRHRMNADSRIEPGSIRERHH